jgi:antitoxin MazE
MGSTVRTHIVRIGNSRGVRIPKVWLEQLDLGSEVEMAVEADRLVIRSARRPRQGWEEQFHTMHERGDDRPVEGFPTPTWDQREWDWQ